MSSLQKSVLHFFGIRILAAFALLVGANLAAADRPNILWVVSEDNSPEYLGAYGNPIARTPNIDALAAKGTLFQRAYTAPVCSPSRSTIITGAHAASLGTQHMRSERPLPEGVRLFPELIREAGYYTSNNSKTDYNTSASYEAAWDESSNTAHWRNREPGQPFFAIFNFHESHASRQLELGPLQTDPAAVRLPEYLPDTRIIRNDLARYQDSVNRADAAIGEILDQLEADGLAEDTIVFYYSDHGGAVVGSKRFPNEAGTRAALVTYFPPKYAHLAPTKPGEEYSELVHFADLAPTLFSILGLEPLEQFQGRAFAGPAKAPAPDTVFMSVDRIDERYSFLRALTDGRYRYIRNYYPDRAWGQWSDFLWRSACTKEWELYFKRKLTTPEQSQFFEPAPVEALYDITADPDNVHNLANDPAHRETLLRLRQALRDYQLEINDAGFMPEPLVVKLADGQSPRAVTGDSELYPLPEIIDWLDAVQIEKGPTPSVDLKNAPTVFRYWLASAAPDAPLDQLLKDSEPTVRIAAAEALLRRDPKDATALAVYDALFAPDQGRTEVQVFALDSLARISPDLSDSLANRLGEFAALPTWGGIEYFLARVSRHLLADHRKNPFIRNRELVPTTFPLPYPKSEHIGGLEFDWSTHQRHAIGSDNFQLAWADDGHLYGAWGDGGGFGGNNRQGRVGLGFARIEGPADDYRGFNVWGGLEPENPATFDGKSWGTLALPGELYMWTVPDVPPGKGYRNHYELIELARSTDYGANWEKADWHFTQSDELIVPTFLNFGQANAGVPSRMDGYVYSYFIHPENAEMEHQGPRARGLTTQIPGYLYLARAKPDQLFESREAYEFFTGLKSDGSPTWGSLTEKKPVFTDPNGVGWCVSAAYHPGLDRILLATEHGLSHHGQLGFFDAPNPWGPWTTVEYYQPGDHFGIQRPGDDLPWRNNVFYASFPTKWFDDDTFTLSFTGGGSGADNDSFNTIQGRFLKPAQ